MEASAVRKFAVDFGGAVLEVCQVAYHVRDVREDVHADVGYLAHFDCDWCS